MNSNSFVVMTDPFLGGSLKERREQFEYRVDKYCRGVEYLFLIGDIAGDVRTADEAKKKVKLPHEELEHRTRDIYSQLMTSIGHLRTKRILPNTTRVLSDTRLANCIPQTNRLEYNMFSVGGKNIVGLGSKPVRKEYHNYRVGASEDAELDLLWTKGGRRRPDIVILNGLEHNAKLATMITAHRNKKVPNPGLYIITRQSVIDPKGEVEYRATKSVTQLKEAGITRYTIRDNVLERLRHRFVKGELKSYGVQSFQKFEAMEQKDAIPETVIEIPPHVAIERLLAELEFAFVEGNEVGMSADFLKLRNAFIQKGMRISAEVSEDTRKEFEGKLKELEDLVREKSGIIVKMGEQNGNAAKIVGESKQVQELRQLVSKAESRAIEVQEELGRNMERYSDHVTGMGEAFKRKETEVEASKLRYESSERQAETANRKAKEAEDKYQKRDEEAEGKEKLLESQLAQDKITEEELRQKLDEEAKRRMNIIKQAGNRKAEILDLKDQLRRKGLKPS